MSWAGLHWLREVVGVTSAQDSHPHIKTLSAPSPTSLSLSLTLGPSAPTTLSLALTAIALSHTLTLTALNLSHVLTLTALDLSHTLTLAVIAPTLTSIRMCGGV